MEKLDLTILIRRAWLLIIAAILGGALALAVTLFRPTVYEAHAQLMVGPGIESPNPDLNVLRAGGQLIQMYAELPMTEPFLLNVINRLKLDITPQELIQYIEIQPNQETQILTIQVQHSDENFARATAAAIAEELVRVSPSNPESSPALIKDQMRAQIIELEETVAEIKESIPALQIDYENAVEEEKLSREEAGSFKFISGQLDVFEDNLFSGTAATQKEAGMKILQELVINTNARILKFERQLKEDTNTTTQKLIIDQVRLERNHLSQLQQTIAEIERPVEGLPLDQYIEATQARLAELENDNRLSLDFQRLQLERINREQERLDQARLIESNRQKAILQQIADERERISQVELASIEKQRLILEQISSQRVRLTETQNTLALLYNSIREADPNQVNIIELPTQANPIASSEGLTVILGMLAGAGLATIGVLMVDNLDERVKTGEHFASVLPVPILDVDEKRGGFAGLLSSRETQQQRIQKYQMLGIKLLFSQHEKNARVVLVGATDETSSAGAVAANLATSLAQAGKRVLLVDLEGNNPVISSMFGLGEQAGVSDYLFRPADRPLSLVPVVGLPTLRVWPYGTVDIGSSQLMSQRLVDALRVYEDEADIILCAVPMINRPDTLLMASWSDGVVLVTTKGKTDEKTLRDIVANLDMVDGEVLAAVLKSGPETKLLFERQREQVVGGIPAGKPIDRLSSRAGENPQQ